MTLEGGLDRSSGGLSQEIVWIETESSGQSWKRSEPPHSGTTDAGGYPERKRSGTGKTGEGIEDWEVDGSAPEGFQSARFQWQLSGSPDYSIHMRKNCSRLTAILSAPPLRWKSEIGVIACGDVWVHRRARRPLEGTETSVVAPGIWFHLLLHRWPRGTRGKHQTETARKLKRKVT
jgi:hypothetical protein